MRTSYFTEISRWFFPMKPVHPKGCSVTIKIQSWNDLSTSNRPQPNLDLKLSKITVAVGRIPRNPSVLCRKPCRKCPICSPNRPISGFSGVRPDGDHTATPAAHQRRRESDLNGHPEITHSSVRCFEWDILVHLSHSITSSY